MVKTTKTKTPEHKWIFKPRFRKGAFGWRSETAIKRVKEAVSEIKKVSRQDPVLGAEGAVIFLERVSPALEHVDSSSGAIGNAVNRAIDEFVKILSKAKADAALRDAWLNRLREAIDNDGMGYLDLLPEHWGELCVTPERASEWVEEYISLVRSAWKHHQRGNGGSYFHGIIICLSSLHKAGRFQELLDLLELTPYNSWTYHSWGLRALIEMGRLEDALVYAEAKKDINRHESECAGICEKILMDLGRYEEAYKKYALLAHSKSTYLATFREICKHYPDIPPAKILEDLIATTPGQEGKWFASARHAGLYQRAMELAGHTSCEPLTLVRAVRNEVTDNSDFACEIGLAALSLLIRGYGYEITDLDVRDAFNHTLEAARQADRLTESLDRIKIMLYGFSGKKGMVVELLEKFLDRELSRESEASME